MIKDYKRPATMAEALEYLGDKSISPVVLSGGSYQTEFAEGEFTGIDLQALELDRITMVNDKVEIGAMTTLQELADHKGCGSALHQTITLEAGRNVRNSRSMLAHLRTCNGRSALGTVLLAQDTNLIWQPEDRSVTLGDYFAIRGKKDFGYFFSHLNWSRSIKTAFESIARSPVDQPMVCVALTKWPSGRTRIALGGFGDTPLMAFD
ncbi:MAG: FAD binding domain-containing protein, partial [Anaerolineaceae bacterium]|nr:FAD binding domain-containing protein [Anaerolineaceae bacterium]